MREQWLAAGAALGNLLNAAHQLGFGAIVLSGERCFDPALHSALGLREGEHLAGFISLGSITSQPSPRATVAPSSMRTAWQAEQAAAVTAQALLQPDGNHDSHGSDL
ncbi:nitroreductase family protein [Delftia sp. CH05]|uniref:nitroreductase family protein n=1 Tax=Delftia sp. CH05 TaxID=2692194 RepID=UPI00135E27B3|nr:nitroreductase family protein [Delftia sp. CH05]MXN31321.1 nitroreductase [Delftia sp. CH05]